MTNEEVMKDHTM